MFAGFLRTPDGTITTFVVPGSTEAIPVSINPEGTIVGSHGEASGGGGFLRARDGSFTTFEYGAAGINPQGAITGSYFDGHRTHGFLRAPDGTFTFFDAPGSRYTVPRSINPEGTITGSYADDASGASHGFVIRPKKDSHTDSVEK